MENNDFWGIHKHHIVFRSQGGLDFDLNMIELTQEEHEGNHGPHQSRARSGTKERITGTVVRAFSGRREL